MSKENDLSPAPKKPFEVFGLNENEALYWRVNKERFEELFNDDQTLVHEINEASNSFGEFLFVTTSRPGEEGRIYMTFYGQGFHEHRERWITDEWYWYQASPYPDMLSKKLEKEEAQELIEQRIEEIKPYISDHTQTNRGRLFELLADLTDEDGALTELQDLGHLAEGLMEDEEEPEIIPPTGENLLDDKSREKLPPLYSGEEQGLDALAHVKFFTPDAQWSWFASEYDGEDVFFGLVDGLELELGYFSLSELKEVKGPMGLAIERDIHFEPKSLRELRDQHQRERGRR
jgi:hypothetical protein